MEGWGVGARGVDGGGEAQKLAGTSRMPRGGTVNINHVSSHLPVMSLKL